MMNNIGMLMQMLKGSGNPQQMAMNMIQQKMGNNPMAQNIAKMIGNNDVKGLEEFARNAAKSKNIDIDSMLSQIKQFMN